VLLSRLIFHQRLERRCDKVFELVDAPSEMSTQRLILFVNKFAALKQQICVYPQSGSAKISLPFNCLSLRQRLGRRR
jgi:hypothetical protein